ncbi:hypothetical protein ASG87_04535 [Frateuria sp. Soil773]|uniref:hypothetical protein n=1 Tax=Frateuria sp. Soil773 TaxID=1736407 RepID=UPI0006FDE847|nr:hypothetical protein [Frateuria sp. Soil773]KRE89598.1 hypothetical protein ASG87_04535 [Frateuria sp. Soil773]
MPARRLIALLCLAVPVSSAAGAHPHAPGPHELYMHVAGLTNDLARYQYLSEVVRGRDPADRQLAGQLLASTESELGLYDDAVRQFPFDNRDLPAPETLPRTDAWRAMDAADAIVSLARDRRIVMVNEAHHDAHTRELTLELLPRLRALGFTHFAAEALSERDDALAKRGYPIPASGSEYLREPLLGEIVREALRLGFVVVPYDSASADNAVREADQARHLYQRVFAGHPGARLFVHAGYAHIDKSTGRLGGIEPMAMQLRQLTGIEPLCIDQSQFRWVGYAYKADPYMQLVGDFDVRRPTVLVRRDGRQPWSSAPTRYDASVILPPSGRWGRPRWLALGGLRRPHMVNTDLCRHTLPCVVEAHYPAEPDDAIPADRTTFLSDDRQATLYLRPGRYRLRAWDSLGRPLGERNVRVSPP